MASLRRRALLIGTENHDDARFTALPSARADIEQLAQMLGHRNIGAFAEIRVKSDLRATEMRHTIDAFLRDCGDNELALLYISGHGTRLVTSESEFFFGAADTDHDHIERTAMGAGFVNECLEDSPSIWALECAGTARTRWSPLTTGPSLSFSIPASRSTRTRPGTCGGNSDAANCSASQPDGQPSAYRRGPCMTPRGRSPAASIHQRTYRSWEARPLTSVSMGVSMGVSVAEDRGRSRKTRTSR